MRKWIVAWALLISITLAWAANTSLSNLTAAGSVSGTDLFYDVQTAGVGGVKATISQLATYLFSQVSGSCTATSGGTFSCAQVQPGYGGGTWYQSCNCTVGTGTGVATNTIRLYPFSITSSFTMTDLGARVTTAGTGTAQLAIYKSTTGSMPFRPTGTPLGFTATLDTSAATGCGATCPGLLDGTFVAGSGSNVTITPGLYWFAINSSVAGTIFTSVNTGSTSGMSYLVGSATQANVSSTATVANLSLSVTQTYTSGFPDLTSAIFTESTSSTYALLQFKAM
jgi:hypothetical protein